MTGPPTDEPIGRLLASVAKSVSRAFQDELAAAGGSQPVWLLLLALKQGRGGRQQELAAAVGIEGPTVTHHLDGLERAGLITRARDPEDRRAMKVELTPDGEALFRRLARAARSFDERLRDGLSEAEVDAVREVLRKLRANVAPE
ncbi:MAG TPA: MarR family transcriptional regulator [Solirubrobacteraceae bacterium]|jgi:MarR family transcriptional regulator for hemolysin